MKEEEKSYIESYLAKVIGICINLSYTRDRLGNLIFENKEDLNNNINRLISQSATELEASEEDIKNYLIKVYKKKSKEPEHRVETQRFISVLESMQENKSKEEVETKELIK